MPRPNPPRPIGREAVLASRIAYERQARGWTYENLASRMARAGCPINASALHKIEKGSPPRRITVDEFVALSHVLGLSPTDLLMSSEDAVGKRLRGVYEHAAETAEALTFAHEAHYQALAEAATFIDQHRDELVANEATHPLTGWLMAAYEALVPDEETRERLDERVADRARGKM